ncbi:MAG: aspartyl protease family protein [Burkholderiales bacterium]|nr:aspartyl protease family protein [Burkholderiales bacterium]
MLRTLLTLVLSLCAAAAVAQAPAPARGAAKPDPLVLLAVAKAASGGSAWDSLRTQKSEVKLATAGLEGAVERLTDIQTGRSLLRYSIGPLSGAAGYDGKTVWTQDGQEPAKVETGAAALELAANAAYRDKLAFWYPDRGRARIEYKERAQADGRAYDVVTITPEGGRAFEFWLDAETNLIERLVEREADVTRTEIYSDRRDVQGVRIPFHTRTTRGDPKFDEVVTVQKIAFNEPVATVAFGPPVEAQELSFPQGRAAVEVPFEVYSGHLFVNVMLDGRGPFRMLLDAGGANVLSQQTAQALIGPRPLPKVLPVASTMINGVELSGQRYIVADIDGFLRRVEGLDNIAGVLGLEWFVRMPIKIDYARSRLTLYDPDKFKYSGAGVRVPVAVRGRLPQVRGSIEGIEGLFEIDTGSRGSLTITPAFAAKHDLGKRLNAKTVAITGAGAGGPLRATLGRGKLLKIGSVEVPSPVVAIAQGAPDAAARAEVAGNIGFGVMRQFAVTYDLPNDALYFERYINFGTPDIADRGGLWLERVDEGYKVVDVVVDGPAATAGLKAGDMIVEINGYPAAQTPLPAAREALRSSPGSRVRMKTASGNEVVIVLRDLV